MISRQSSSAKLGAAPPEGARDVPGFLDLHGRTNKADRAAANARIRRHGLHLGQDHLLALLWAEDGRTPGELAAALEVSTPPWSRPRPGCPTRACSNAAPDDRDHRLVRIWLTDAGRALQFPLEQERRVLEEDLIADLSDAERDQLLAALAKVHRAATRLQREST
jgi:DNA-binding MarR family transcriptional regulator